MLRSSMKCFSLYASRNFRTVKARLAALCKLVVTYPWTNRS